MNSIIHHLLIQNQYLLQIISFLFKFICKYIPLRQWIFDDSNSPEYQKFKVDEPPLIKKPVEAWFYKDFLAYIKWKYDVDVKPVKRRSICDIPDNYICPHCNAPKEYLYKNNGSHNQILCKVCGNSSSCNPQEFEVNSIVHFTCTLLKFKFFRFVSEIYHLKPPLYDFNNSISKSGTNIKTKCLLYCPFCAIC